jgi:hypothetical protein
MQRGAQYLSRQVLTTEHSPEEDGTDTAVEEGPSSLRWLEIISYNLTKAGYALGVWT